MNERIKELALEAFQPINSMASEGVADYYTFEQTWFQLYNQKFAELIIRECCDVLTENVEVALNASGSPVYPEGLIYERFGIEE